MPSRPPKIDFSPVNHKPRRIPKVVPPAKRALRRQEEEIHEMVAEAKKKIKVKLKGNGNFKLDEESSKTFNALLLELRRRRFSLRDICKIVLPLFQEGKTPESIYYRVQKRISKAERAQGIKKIEFGKRRGPQGRLKWQTMDEKHAEAIELNKFYGKVEKIRPENPLAAIGQIARKTGYPYGKASKMMKVLYEGVGEPKKTIFDSKSPKRKIRSPVFTKKEKFELVYGRHVGLIKTKVAKEFRAFGPEVFEDQLAEVNLRLLDELDLFDPSKGVKVSTFIGERAGYLAQHLKQEYAIRNKGKPEYLKAKKREILREQREQ